ncbi:MAG: hypothetical protein IH936_14515 [Acidobacteria bacterium]|nr:hypothetical protein [Acidobacteriota bacterium]
MDSPLLQSGADSGKIDAPGRLRMSAIRGVGRIATRALIGPLTKDLDLRRLLQLEDALWGASAGDKGGATVRLEDGSADGMSTARGFARRKDGGVPRQGHPAVARNSRLLIVRPRPVLRKTALDLAALWASMWAGFHFLGVGNRSRRGYGALTIAKAAGLPNLDDFGFGGSLPLFPRPPADRAALASNLKNGLQLARAVMRKWLAKQDPPVARPDSAPSSSATAYFQFLGPRDILVAKPETLGSVGFNKLMQHCSRVRRHNNINLGHLRDAGERQASQIWFRFWQLGANKVVLIATRSLRRIPDAPDSSLDWLESWTSVSELTQGSGNGPS